MADYSDYQAVQQMLTDSQAADSDQREEAREVEHFLHKADGQWDPAIVSKMSGRYRGTFDQCGPVVDSIAGELEQAEFAIKVGPGSGEASEDTAETLSGMIRNIESMSKAVNTIYGPASRQIVESGFDAWRVVQDWAEGDSFDQDLFIRKIPNAVDRVWFDCNSFEQDRSDANHAFVLSTISTGEYEEKWPEGGSASVGDGNDSNVYDHKPENVVVGEIVYRKTKRVDLVLMSNHSVYKDDDKFQSVADELKDQGITETRRRTTDSSTFYTRKFDGSDWLEDEKETVFDMLSVIPAYGNFRVSENKVIYRGAIAKLMDPQRAYNYAQSRTIEDAALSPKSKVWMTPEQVTGHEDTLATMNTNNYPIQQYNHTDGQIPPSAVHSSMPNAGLQVVSADMRANITSGSGIFAANMGDNVGLQSGVAIDLQQKKGDNSTFKYFKAMEIALAQTAKVLISAIPRAYDVKRVVRILGEDGVSDSVELNSQILDEESGKMVGLNDLSTGKYDVTCSSGASFQNRQQETSKAFLEMAALDPNIMQMGEDILLNNVSAPGMKQLAGRARMRLLLSGVIPASQQTDEEKEKLQKVQEIQAQQQQPDPMGQAMLEEAQAQTADVISKTEERQAKAMLEVERIRQAERDLDIKEAQAQDKAALDFQSAILQQNREIIENLNTQAATMKILMEANAQSLAQQQAQIVDESQGEQE